jgi:hypothetical protein
MKKLIAMTLMFISVSAFANVSGDKILFQKESTYVSVVYNKSLCLDGNTYRAVIDKCMQWANDDRRACLRSAKVRVTQPVESTRQRCAATTDRGCSAWETVRFNQDPVRTVTFFNDEGRELDTKTYIVKACN